jgi:hypothetical protein
VDQPELAVRYRVLSLGTLEDHFRALSGPRNRYLLGQERSAFWMALRYLGRALAFNRLTVPLFWLPVFRLAERSQGVERWIRSSFYRGVISHYFSRAVRSASTTFKEGTRGS